MILGSILINATVLMFVNVRSASCKAALAQGISASAAVAHGIPVVDFTAS
jgi:hypothetical protein